jgi:hypothetical protein
LQEETIRRNERERKSMSDKISNLERSLTTAETDKRQQAEKLAKMKVRGHAVTHDFSYCLLYSSIHTSSHPLSLMQTRPSFPKAE